jgi:predicted CXXCH cytochrome family protein
MKKKKIIKTLLLTLIISLTAIQADTLDYPHTGANNIGCDSCHFIYGGEPSLLPPWTSHTPQDIDDTQYNTLCWSCHNGLDFIYVRTHSSLSTDNSYGDWSVECRTCHNPHYQKQFRTYGNASYLYQGIVSSVTATTLTESGAGWTPDEYVGLILVPNAAKVSYNYQITGNTDNTLTVNGTIDTTRVSAGNTFAIVYGKLVKSTIRLDDITTYIGVSTDIPDVNTIVETGAGWGINQYQGLEVIPNSSQPSYKYSISSNTSDTLTVQGPMDLAYVDIGDIFKIVAVKTGDRAASFFRTTGSNSFADGIGEYDGVCEVCHTQTNHFRNDGAGPDPTHTNMGAIVGTNCMDCHNHVNGFTGMGGGAHDTHVTNEYGPKLTCADCHGVNVPPMLRDGQDLANTAVCNNCHSATDAGTAKTFWQENLGTWVAAEGEAGYCGGCHNETPGNSKQDGTGDTTVNIVGDNTTYGFFVTGHGKSAGNYARLSWQDTSAIGNPAANRSCSACHNLNTPHFGSVNSRLKTEYENDINNRNCKQCHNPGTAATGVPDWYTTYPDYQSSAHKTKKCSDCHDVHGASGAYPAMTIANQESLCYQCHTEGVVENDAISNNRPGFYNSADDIQEAFSKSEKHNLGTLFSVGSNSYNLECVSCHNVHIITGKYWDAEQGKSPVTRFTNNTKIWGDEPGEKIDDFAALGSGTGGFYYKTAQGYSLGATGLSFDRPAEYRPPKAGSGYEAEFDGDVLPDYTTFCLDCHQYNMGGGTQGSVNWGGDAHGLSSANKPSYISDAGTAGAWGTSGNPDVLFDMNYVTRGRNTGHFMRWPYDSADRAAGINFVLSCTDCHEAHGSNRGSMIRERYNVNDSGACGSGSSSGENCNDGGNWNQFCNACHYYYGGQHAGMSCGNASCHLENSIHRIDKAGGGGSTHLMLTAAGYEGNFQKPDFTPDIQNVAGHIGSDQLTVVFRAGVYAADDLTGAITADDFWLFDKNSDNPRTITNVAHTGGDSTATITMSAPLVEADLSADTLAIKPASAWSWYEGGYVNAATGMIGAEVVSAGPWPVNVTGPPPFNIQGVLYGGLELKLNGIVNDSDQIYVTFAEGAYSDIGAGGDLQAVDFVMSCGGRIISSVTHTAGDSFAILTLDTIVDQSEIGVCTVAAAPGSIFDSYGNPAGIAAVTLALPPEASVDDLVLRWDFNEGSGTVADSSGALGTQEDMHGVLTRNVEWAASTKPGAVAGDNMVKLDRISDSGAVQLNYTVNPDDGFPPATYNNGGAPIIVQEMQQTSEFSFSVWIKPSALGCQEGKDLGLNTKLRRDVLTTQFWIKNWALGIMRFSNDGDPITGDCTDEDSTHDVLRLWVAVGDPGDMRCDPWGGSWPETVYPVSPAGYIQGTYLQPTNQAVCDNSANPILPTNPKAHSFAQTETLASGAPAYGGVALQSGVWQHVVGTWDGRYIRIYVDGQLAAETDMGGTGNYIMLDDPHLWGGDLIGDGSLTRHVSSFFSVGARPIFSSSGSPSGGAVYWNTNGFYDLGSLTYVGELDDVKYWKIALPLATIQN